MLSRYHATGPQATESITVLRLPLQAGATWPGRTLAGAIETIAVIGRETVAVPGGTFQAGMSATTCATRRAGATRWITGMRAASG